MANIYSEAIQVYGAKVIAGHLKAMRIEVEGVRTSKDIEYIHRMRVASRRMRSAFTIFRNCFTKKEYKAFNKDIRDVTRSLGEARDLDVQLALIDGLMSEFADLKMKPGIRRLRLRLSQKRAIAQEHVVKSMNTLEADRTLEQLQKWLEPYLSSSYNVYIYSPALYELGFSSVNARLEELLSHVEFIWDEANITELHAMRISAKRLRYTLEAFDELYSSKLKPFINQTRKLQDLLGAIHDADVWVAMIPGFIEEEREKILTYFGNPRPLRRLLPGLEAFSQNRQLSRKNDYSKFLDEWRSLEKEQIWDSLLKLINTPLNIEEALKLLSQIDQNIENQSASAEEGSDLD